MESGKPKTVNCVVCGKVYGMRGFLFPIKNEKRRTRWIQALKLDPAKVKTTTWICCRHFKKEDYPHGRIKGLVCPTIQIQDEHKLHKPHITLTPIEETSCTLLHSDVLKILTPTFNNVIPMSNLFYVLPGGYVPLSSPVVLSQVHTPQNKVPAPEMIDLNHLNDATVRIFEEEPVVFPIVADVIQNNLLSNDNVNQENTAEELDPLRDIKVEERSDILNDLKVEDTEIEQEMTLGVGMVDSNPAFSPKQLPPRIVDSSSSETEFIKPEASRTTKLQAQAKIKKSPLKCFMCGKICDKSRKGVPFYSTMKEKFRPSEIQAVLCLLGLATPNKCFEQIIATCSVKICAACVIPLEKSVQIYDQMTSLEKQLNENLERIKARIQLHADSMKEIHKLEKPYTMLQKIQKLNFDANPNYFNHNFTWKQKVELMARSKLFNFFT